MVVMPGDRVLLGQQLVNMQYWGHVTDLDSPTGAIVACEAVGDVGQFSFDVLQGPRGLPGINAPVFDVLWDPAITEVGDLPADPGPAFKNKGYWIKNPDPDPWGLLYIWTGNTGSGWKPIVPGPAGPRGLTPEFDVTVESISWADQQAGAVSEVIPGGGAANPSLHFKIAAPRGPEGPSGRIRLAADYSEEQGAPQAGWGIFWDNEEGYYKPADPNFALPRFYSVPEGAFTNFSGVAQRQQICSFPIPPQPFDWVPIVIGHIRAVGLEVDSDPLIIGSEVRLGDPSSGQLVSRGFGTIASWTTFTPHFSTNSTAMDAASPDGSVGRVPANHSGDEGTLYVNLYNDGLVGIYNFNKAGAQLGVIVMPV